MDDNLFKNIIETNSDTYVSDLKIWANSMVGEFWNPHKEDYVTKYELPDALLHAYDNICEFTGDDYLVEYKGGFYYMIDHIYNDRLASDLQIHNNDELYDVALENAKAISKYDEFKDTIIIVNKGDSPTGSISSDSHCVSILINPYENKENLERIKHILDKYMFKIFDKDEDIEKSPYSSDCKDFNIIKNEPIYLVTYDNKGLSETNFISTKSDLIKDISIEEDFFNSFDGDVKHNTYYVSANKTYDIRLCKSVTQLVDFLNGKFNSEFQELIRDKMDNGDYDCCYDDWYWCNEPEWCSKEAIDIAKLYALSTDDIEQQKSILMGLNLISVERLLLSATQSEAAVMINGQIIVRYADDMWLHDSERAEFINGFNNKTVSEVKYFKQLAGSWGSIKSDEVFIKSALEQFPNKVKDVLMESIGVKTVVKPEPKVNNYTRTLDYMVNDAESRKKQNNDKNTNIFIKKEI